MCVVCVCVCVCVCIMNVYKYGYMYIFIVKRFWFFLHPYVLIVIYYIYLFIIYLFIYLFYFYFILFYIYIFSFNCQQFVMLFCLNINSMCLFSYIRTLSFMMLHRLWLCYIGSVLPSLVDLQIFAIIVVFVSINHFIHLHFCFKFFYYFILTYFCISLSICFGTLHFVHYEQSILLIVIAIPS